YYEYLKDLHDKGIQIFVVSKNDKENVLKEFKIQNIDPNMFTKIIANREPKYLNIKNLLHQLEGVKSEQVIFVDDNPLERDEVEKTIPNIHAIDYRDREQLSTIPYLKQLKKQQEARVEERKNSYRT
ncbi:MAG: HAD-IIIC family phosphatase, partial [bacterium]